jgi:hypothetical protein
VTLEITGRRLAILAGALAVALVAWLYLRERRLPPEEAIHKLIDDGVAAAERGDVNDLMELVSERYQADGSGPEDRRELRQLLTALLFRGGLEVQIVSRDVVLEDERAGTVDLTVILVRGGLRGMSEGDAGARDIHLRVELEDGDWKVVSSRHESSL